MGVESSRHKKDTLKQTTEKRVPPDKPLPAPPLPPHFKNIGINKGTKIEETHVQGLWKHYSETVERHNTKYIVITKKNAIQCLCETAQVYGISYDEEKATALFDECGTIFGNLNEEQFKVLLWNASSVIRYTLSLPDSTKPIEPHSVQSPYHKIHPLKAIKGLQSHVCNVCTKDIKGDSYRCDECDFDICLDCFNKDDYEEKKQTVLKELENLRQELLLIKEKNDLHKQFQISYDEVLTIDLLDKRHRKVTQNCHNASESDTTYLANCNNLKEIYWQDISQKEEILRIYNSYIPYRGLYSSLEHGSDLINDLYEIIGKIKDDLLKLFDKEEHVKQSQHLLVQEVGAFHCCVQTMLRFINPLSPLLPKENSSGDLDRIRLFIKLLQDKDIPPKVKNMLLNGMLFDDNIPDEFRFFVLMHLMSEKES